jgi:hypothetical protein
MKKLLQLSLVALAGSFAFSCSPAKEYYQYAAKDSAYGYKAPKKESVEAATASTVLVAEAVKEEALAEETVLEASTGAELASAAAYAAPAYVLPAKKAVKSKTTATVAPVATEKASAETKVMGKKDIKQKIKDIKKTERLSGNLRIAVILALAAIVASLIPGLWWLGSILGLGAAVFFVLWIVDEL